jgi:hypothetical protein
MGASPMEGCVDEASVAVPVAQYIAPTPEAITRAKGVALQGWRERARERGYAEEPTDLWGACKFASLFAQRLFGGDLRGNEHHQYLVLDDVRIDLTEDSLGLVELRRKHIDPYRHDARFWGNAEHRESMASCAARVDAWVAAFRSPMPDPVPPQPLYGGNFLPSPDQWVAGLSTVFACALHDRFKLPMKALVEETAADGFRTVVHAFCVWEGKVVDGSGVRDRFPEAADFTDQDNPGTSLYYGEEASLFRIVDVTREDLQELHYIENMDDTASARWFIDHSGLFGHMG